MEDTVDRLAPRGTDTTFQIHLNFGEPKRWIQYFVHAGTILSLIFLFLFLFFTIYLFHSYFLSGWWSTFQSTQNVCVNWKMHHTMIACYQGIFTLLIFISLIKCLQRGKAIISELSKQSSPAYLLTLLHEEMSAWELGDSSKISWWHFLIPFFIPFEKYITNDDLTVPSLSLSSIVLNSCKSMHKNFWKSWKISCFPPFERLELVVGWLSPLYKALF